MKRIGNGKRITLMAVMALLLLGGSAGTTIIDSTNLFAFVDVPGVGQIDATTDIDFGIWDGLTTVDAQGSVTVTMSVETYYSLSIDAGLHLAGERRLYAGGTAYFPYFLYQDPSYTTEWGDSDLAGSYPNGGAKWDWGTGVAQVHPVYGRLLPYGSSPPAGFYSDMLLVTLEVGGGA